MATQLTADHAKQSLNAHVAAKGAEIFEKYGPHIGLTELRIILQDRACVRYPCELVFDSAHLNPGEFAFPAPNGDKPEEGFTLYVHPIYMTQLADVPLLALYQLVTVNYGEFASAEDAETFASHALGIHPDEYYERLCALADELGVAIDPGTGFGGGVPPAFAGGSGRGCGGGGCGHG
jgi:hypothetical protein